jgi:cation/acetate symporter
VVAGPDGGGAAVGAVLLTVLSGGVGVGWVGTLLAQPAAWTVPLAFTVMVVVSLITRRQIPASVGATMLRLHAPDALRL